MVKYSFQATQVCSYLEKLTNWLTYSVLTNTTNHNVTGEER